MASGPSGRPLMFADLYDHRWATATYGLLTTGIASVCAGLAADGPVLTGLGGGLLAVCGIVAAANLAATPARMLAAAPTTAAGQAAPLIPR